MFSKRSRYTDILLNMLLPIVAGASLYMLPSNFRVPEPVKNHLADGLWAYAFLSALLITWKRRVHKGWLIIVVISSVGFEAAQYCAVVPGTADVGDVITYVVFFSISLITNPFLKQFFYPNLIVCKT